MPTEPLVLSGFQNSLSKLIEPEHIPSTDIWEDASAQLNSEINSTSGHGYDYTEPTTLSQHLNPNGMAVLLRYYQALDPQYTDGIECRCASDLNSDLSTLRNRQNHQGRKTVILLTPTADYTYCYQTVPGSRLATICLLNSTLSDADLEKLLKDNPLQQRQSQQDNEEYQWYIYVNPSPTISNCRTQDLQILHSALAATRYLNQLNTPFASNSILRLINTSYQRTGSELEFDNQHPIWIHPITPLLPLIDDYERLDRLTQGSRWHQERSDSNPNETYLDQLRKYAIGIEVIQPKAQTVLDIMQGNPPTTMKTVIKKNTLMLEELAKSNYFLMQALQDRQLPGLENDDYRIAYQLGVQNLPEDTIDRPTADELRFNPLEFQNYLRTYHHLMNRPEPRNLVARYNQGNNAAPRFGTDPRIVNIPFLRLQAQPTHSRTTTNEAATAARTRFQPSAERSNIIDISMPQYNMLPSQPRTITSSQQPPVAISRIQATPQPRTTVSNHAPVSRPRTRQTMPAPVAPNQHTTVYSQPTMPFQSISILEATTARPLTTDQSRSTFRRWQIVPTNEEIASEAISTPTATTSSQDSDRTTLLDMHPDHSVHCTKCNCNCCQIM